MTNAELSSSPKLVPVTVMAVGDDAGLLVLSTSGVTDVMTGSAYDSFASDGRELWPATVTMKLRSRPTPAMVVTDISVWDTSS